ncbi:hypothetical protein F5887DRAFT_925658 [Amanita rubescens]|nr:hypothetical protein F5887DRAFT_925658 [Amanita rubescens]
MSSTLHSWREALAAHKREHYSECSQLIFNHATEFDGFVAKYHASQFKISLDEPLSRDLQYACHDAYLGLYDGSIDPEVISESFWTLVEHWDSIRMAAFTNGQTHPGLDQLHDEPQSAATVNAMEEVIVTSEPSVNDSQTLPETPKERITECSTSIHGLAGLQAQTPSLLGKTREERRVYNSVVSIHAKGEDISSPNTSAALTLPELVPISSPIPTPHITPKPHSSTPSCKHDSPRVIREVRRTRDSTSESRNTSGRVRMTRSQTCPSSLKSDSLSMPRELQRNTRSSLTDTELSKARKVDLPGKPPSESSMETATTVSHNLSKSRMLVENRQLPKSSVLVGKLAKPRVVATASSRVPIPGVAPKANLRMENKAVSTKERADDSEYAPSTKTALTLSEHSPVSLLRAHPPHRLLNEPKPNFPTASKRRMPSISIITKRKRAVW